VVELTLVDASALDDDWACGASEACEADEVEDADEVESTLERRFVRYAVNASDSWLMSEAICEAVDVEEAVDVDEAMEAVEAVDVEDAVEALDDCSALNRLVRSASSVDSRLLALVELSVELDEVELLETPGGGPDGGPPTPDGPPLELALLSDEL